MNRREADIAARLLADNRANLPRHYIVQLDGTAVTISDGKRKHRFSVRRPAGFSYRDREDADAFAKRFFAFVFLLDETCNNLGPK